MLTVGPLKNLRSKLNALLSYKAVLSALLQEVIWIPWV